MLPSYQINAMTRKLLEKYGSLYVADSNTESDIEAATENILSDFFMQNQRTLEFEVFLEI